MIFYETANRIENFFSVAQQFFPDCHSFIARELTKIHEEKLHGIVTDLSQKLAGSTTLKGEFVIIIHNNHNEKNVTFENNLDRILSSGKKYLPVKDLSKFLSEISNLNKNDIYKLSIKKRDQN